MKKLHKSLLNIAFALAGGAAIVALADYYSIKKDVPKEPSKIEQTVEEIYDYCSLDFNSFGKSNFEKKVIKGHNIYTVFGYHYTNEAADHIYKNVVPELKKNPKDWLFLIEGEHDGEGDFSPENCLAIGLAEKYAIELDDIIAMDSDSDVVDLVKSKGHSEDEIYTEIVGNMYYLVLAGCGDESVSYATAVDIIMEDTGKGKAYLESLLDFYLAENIASDRYDELHKVILDARNDVSACRLEKVLESAPKNVLLVIGGAHYPVVDFPKSL